MYLFASLYKVHCVLKTPLLTHLSTLGLYRVLNSRCGDTLAIRQVKVCDENVPAALKQDVLRLHREREGKSWV